VDVVSFRFRIPSGVDEWFDDMTHGDRRTIRWTYRHARKSGVDRNLARLVIHSAFHVGVRTEMTR
jgi:hypothetical protein